MVAGKVKAAMGFQKSPATPKHELPRRSTSSSSSSTTIPGSNKAPPCSNSKSNTTVFSRSFGVYFPRSSAQVQPRPPDVTELLKLVEELQERESRLRTELLEHKLLKETVAIVPFLEKDLALKNDELDRCKKRIQSLESKIERKEDEERRKDQKIKGLEAEIEEMKRGSESRRMITGEIVDDCSSSSQRFQGLIDASAKSNLLKNLRKCPKSTNIVEQQQQKIEVSEKKDHEEVVVVETEEKKEILKTMRKPPRIPKPPPLPSAPSRSSSSSSLSSSSSSSSSSSAETSTASNMSRDPDLSAIPPVPPPDGGNRRAPAAPPPPPPPPPAKGMRLAGACVRRVPEVVEFYHSLMRRDSKRESGSGVTDQPSAANARNMIGEIENRSAHLLAIKTDVETQGDFIRLLIKEVNSAAFTNIEDLVAFVKWLDDELSYLVDERAVLKHFDWPEHKADAMREAAFGYCDLKKLETDAATFRHDRRQPCSSALKKMQALLEKLEHGVYNVSRMREGATKKYKGFQIPWEWMLDTGFVCQIKLASVKLAMKYMKRVSSELELVAGGPEEEELMLQGVRFAFRVHQFAGGFDVETMRAFQELRDKALSLQSQKQTQHHQQQKLFSRSLSLSC